MHIIGKSFLTELALALVNLLGSPQPKFVRCGSYLLSTFGTVANDNVGIVCRWTADESLTLRSRCSLALHGQWFS
jgi:hypothetical protein